MVTSVEIRNFRAFEFLRVDGLASINVIVGDNAVGKTALLEAIFLTLSGNAQKALNLKQWRGIDIQLQRASADSVVEGIYADLFRDPREDDGDREPDDEGDELDKGEHDPAELDAPTMEIGGYRWGVPWQPQAPIESTDPNGRPGVWTPIARG